MRIGPRHCSRCVHRQNPFKHISGEKDFILQEQSWQKFLGLCKTCREHVWPLASAWLGRRSGMGTGECGAGERDPRREGPAGPPMWAGQGGRARPGRLSASSVPSCGLESVVPIRREGRETKRVFPVAVRLPRHPCA